jgi:hypothetical protein
LTKRFQIIASPIYRSPYHDFALGLSATTTIGGIYCRSCFRNLLAGVVRTRSLSPMDCWHRPVHPLRNMAHRL